MEDIPLTALDTSCQFLFFIRGNRKHQLCSLLSQTLFHLMILQKGIHRLGVRHIIQVQPLGNGLTVIVITVPGNHPVKKIEFQFNRGIYVNADIGNRRGINTIENNPRHQHHQSGTGRGIHPEAFGEWYRTLRKRKPLLPLKLPAPIRRCSIFSY